MAIIVQPISQTATNGGNAVLGVLAIGLDPLAYQWYFDGSPISYATNSILVLTNLTPDNAGGYFDVISNNYGSVTSSVAALTIPFPFSFSTNNGTITVTGWNGEYGASAGDLFIPGSIHGYNVTVIGTNAPQENATLTSVTIPDSVTNICEKAFYDCTQLRSIVIGSNVTSLGDEAFGFCSGLTSVSIGNDVTNIGSFAFEGCLVLTNIAVDTANPVYTSVGGVLFDKAITKLIEFAPGLTGSYAIPGSVKSIGDYAFYWAPGLWSVTISWATNTSVIIQNCTNLADPVWSTIATNVLSNGVANFSEFYRTNTPSCYFRVRTQ